jgi:Ca2+-binding RTX toxin-like protein
MALIQGNNFDNTLNGTITGDTLVGLGGNDTLNGGDGRRHRIVFRKSCGV